LIWPATLLSSDPEIEQRQKEGQVFHRLVQQHILGLPEDRLLAMASTPSLKKWIHNYLDYKFNLNDHVCYPEAALSIRVGPHRLVAKYDLLAVHRDGVSIYDWKTYHRRPRNEQMAARMQTRLYQALLVNAGASYNHGIPLPAQQVAMIYWYAEYPENPFIIRYSPIQHKRDWDAMREIISAIKNHHIFQMVKDEKACTYCNYRTYCHRGKVTGEDMEDDSDLYGPDLSMDQIQEISF
jgi:CRISPR/Cas system-associated exonuclease Cas4 (RecB family)